MSNNLDPRIILVLRKKQNWSQEELAHAAGVSTRTVQRIENGAEASYETKRALALAFDVDSTDLEARDNTPIEDILKEKRIGIYYALIGYICAFIGVSYGIYAGYNNGFHAGLTLGILGALTGIICAMISWFTERRIRSI